MSNTGIPKEIEHLFTKERVIYNHKMEAVKRKYFKPLVQKVTKQEIIILYDKVIEKYGKTFTIDIIKNIPEESMVVFRGTFDFPYYKGKGTIYFDSDNFEIMFDNLERLIKLTEQEKMGDLIV